MLNSSTPCTRFHPIYGSAPITIPIEPHFFSMPISITISLGLSACWHLVPPLCTATLAGLSPNAATPMSFLRLLHLYRCHAHVALHILDPRVHAQVADLGAVIVEVRIRSFAVAVSPGQDQSGSSCLATQKIKSYCIKRQLVPWSGRNERTLPALL